jgi:hypothetical protein
MSQKEKQKIYFIGSKEEFATIAPQMDNEGVELVLVDKYSKVLGHLFNSNNLMVGSESPADYAKILKYIKAHWQQ